MKPTYTTIKQIEFALDQEWSITGRVVNTAETDDVLFAIVAEQPSIHQHHFGEVYHLVSFDRDGGIGVNDYDDMPEDLEGLRKFMNNICEELKNNSK